MNITVRRPIYNPNLLVPGMDVAINIPSIKTVLAESEYQLITSMAGDNFSEPLKVYMQTCVSTAGPVRQLRMITSLLHVSQPQYQAPASGHDLVLVLFSSCGGQTPCHQLSMCPWFWLYPSSRPLMGLISCWC